MANGYWQKLLRVDLSANTATVEDISEHELKRFLGGSGLGAEILRRETDPETDPLGPDNRIMFAAGAFQGTKIPGSAKFSIVGLSPVTGTFADTSTGGGLGPAIKDAGYDVILIQGAASAPVYLHIADAEVDIRDAAQLWGLDAYETADALAAATGDAKLSLATIGPAGEHTVANSCIIVDKHSVAGRCGLGAVMGSKKLKAVAVRGTQSAPVARPDEVQQLALRFQKEIAAEVRENGFREHGTPSVCEAVDALGDMPVKYWQGDGWAEGAKKLDGQNSTAVLQVTPTGCKYCPIGCHRKAKVDEPEELAFSGVGPQYETLGLMGTNLLIDDPKVVAKANDMTNRLGMDTIAAGSQIGFTIECYENGWLDDFDLDGLTPSWGDPNTLFTLIEQIGRAQGFGAIFREGTLKAAETIGPQAVDIVAHCKGLDLPSHDPRTCYSLGPTYATGTRGACHYRGGSEDVEFAGFFLPEIGINEGGYKFFEDHNMSELAARCQDVFVVFNSVCLCAFMVAGGGLSIQSVLDLFNAVTGWDYSMDGLMRAGERGFTSQRLLNLRHGYGAATDALPKKVLQPAKEGFRAGKVPDMAKLMADYYALRRWDPATGRPLDTKLAELELVG